MRRISDTGGVLRNVSRSACACCAAAMWSSMLAIRVRSSASACIAFVFVSWRRTTVREGRIPSREGRTTRFLDVPVACRYDQLPLRPPPARNYMNPRSSAASRSFSCLTLARKMSRCIPLQPEAS